MIDLELRALILKRLHEEVHGDGAERAGLASTIISGAPRDYAVYRDLCGYVRGIESAMRIVEDASRELNEFVQQPQPQVNISNKKPRKGKTT